MAKYLIRRLLIAILFSAHAENWMIAYRTVCFQSAEKSG
jgi:hypothetical protein